MDSAGTLQILPHQNLQVFGHRVRVQFEVFKQHTPPLPISLSRVQFTWCCRCEMCKCCVLYCSQRRNVDTMREAEYVQAHIVEITTTRKVVKTIAQQTLSTFFRSHRRTSTGNELLLVRSHIACVSKKTLSKARVSCSHQERLNSVRTGAVVTSSTSATTRKSDFQTCTSATSATSTSNVRSLLDVSVNQPSHSAAQCFQPCKIRLSATKRSATTRGVDTSSSQFRLCRGSSQSACCMVSGTSCFRAHVY